MRIYLPATLDELDVLDVPTATLPARRGHAVTAALRALLPDEDDEGLEFAAQLAAADDSLDLLREGADLPALRLVVSVDVDGSRVREVDDPDDVPTLVTVDGLVTRDDVACVHVDEPAARQDVTRALGGDPAAVETLDERDLLWYDASELGRIPR